MSRIWEIKQNSFKKIYYSKAGDFVMPITCAASQKEQFTAANWVPFFGGCSQVCSLILWNIARVTLQFQLCSWGWFDLELVNIIWISQTAMPESIRYEQKFWLSIILERHWQFWGLVTNYAGCLEDVSVEMPQIVWLLCWIWQVAVSLI